MIGIRSYSSSELQEMAENAGKKYGGPIDWYIEIGPEKARMLVYCQSLRNERGLYTEVVVELDNKEIPLKCQSN